MNMVADRQSSKKSGKPFVISYLPEFQMVANLKAALETYETLQDKLPNNYIGVTLKNIASDFKAVVTEKKPTGNYFHDPLMRARNGLNSLFPVSKDMKEGSPTADVYSLLTKALVRTYYSVLVDNNPAPK